LDLFVVVWVIWLVGWLVVVIVDDDFVRGCIVVGDCVVCDDGCSFMVVVCIGLELVILFIFVLFMVVLLLDVFVLMSVDFMIVLEVVSEYVFVVVLDVEGLGSVLFTVVCGELLCLVFGFDLVLCYCDFGVVVFDFDLFWLWRDVDIVVVL